MNNKDKIIKGITLNNQAQLEFNKGNYESALYLKSRSIFYLKQFDEDLIFKVSEVLKNE